MANPNPSPATRFSAERPGRAKQKGARDRMSAAFMTALTDDFDEHGKDVIARVREEDPSTYMGVLAGLMPKELEVTRPLDGLNDDLLDAAVQALKEVLKERAMDISTEPETAMLN